MADQNQKTPPVKKGKTERVVEPKRVSRFSSEEIMEEMANDISRGCNFSERENSGNRWVRVPVDQELSVAERYEQRVEELLLGKGPKKPFKVSPRKE